MDKNNVQNEEKKEKRSKKKLLLLLLLLILTGLLLSTSTYAWFTSNRSVKIEDIDVNVAASGGIQLSADGINWKSIVTNDDLEGAHTTYGAATNQLPSTLKPVSTAANSLTNGYLSMWLGTVSTSNSSTNNGEYILSTTDVSTVRDNSDSTNAVAGSNSGAFGNFVMFDLFLRLDDSTANQSTAQPIYLTTQSGVVVTNGSTDLGTQYSARVAFINEGVTTSGDSGANIQALVTSSTANITVWEPNYDGHTATGLSNAYSYYNSANNQQQYNKAIQSPAIQVPYFGVVGSLVVDDDIILSKANPTDTNGSATTTTGTKFAAVTPGLATTEAWNSGSTYEQLLTLLPNRIVKLRIYFWIEGQDIDCENHASGGDITLKLQFSLDSSSNSGGSSSGGSTGS